jgi:hypothetical protein
VRFGVPAWAVVRAKSSHEPGDIEEEEVTAKL